MLVLTETGWTEKSSVITPKTQVIKKSAVGKVVQRTTQEAHDEILAHWNVIRYSSFGDYYYTI